MSFIFLSADAIEHYTSAYLLFRRALPKARNLLSADYRSYWSRYFNIGYSGHILWSIACLALFLGQTVAQKSAISLEEPSFVVPQNVFDSKNLIGVNISGAEINVGSLLPYGYSYLYPRKEEIDYFQKKGFGLIRMPISMRRLQPRVYSRLDFTELERMRQVIDFCLIRNMFVVIDPHEFGLVFDDRIGDSLKIGSDETATMIFADYWMRLASRFKHYPNVIFGLMNEPHLQTPAQWRKGAEAAIRSIRQVGAKQLILIPGTNWSAALNWDLGSASNGSAWDSFDADRNILFEVHQYLDVDGSGTHAKCAIGAGQDLLQNVTKWAKKNRFGLFLGEFGFSPETWENQETHCSSPASALLDQMAENSKVWKGFSYFNGGSWVFYSHYAYGLAPVRVGRGYVDAPQMKVIQDSFFLGRAR